MREDFIADGSLPCWLRWLSVCLQCGRPGFDPWVRKIPWRRKWQSTPVLLPGKSHGQRSLVGYSPWERKESDTTWHLTSKWNHTLLIFCNCLIFCDSSRFIHFAAYGRTVFFFRLKNILLCVHHAASLHSSVDGHLHYFHISAAVNMAVM